MVPREDEAGCRVIAVCGHLDARLVGKGFQPCVREPFHEGRCVVWTQTNPDRKRGRNGVQVREVDHVAGKLQAIVFADFDGCVDADDVAGLVQFMEYRQGAAA